MPQSHCFEPETADREHTREAPCWCSERREFYHQLASRIPTPPPNPWEAATSEDIVR